MRVTVILDLQNHCNRCFIRSRNQPYMKRMWKLQYRLVPTADKIMIKKMISQINDYIDMCNIYISSKNLPIFALCEIKMDGEQSDMMLFLLKIKNLKK